MSAPPSRALALSAAAAGIGSFALLVASLWPEAMVPAWPAASLGALAVWLARRPGPGWPRLIGRGLGGLSTVVALGQIAGLWALALNM